MQQNFLSQKNSIIAVVAVLILLGGGYYWYSAMFTSTSKINTEIDKSVLKKSVADFFVVKEKLVLNNVSFKEKEVYNKLEDYTEEIPFLPPPGRKNPFVPYVAP